MLGVKPGNIKRKEGSGERQEVRKFDSWKTEKVSNMKVDWV